MPWAGFEPQTFRVASSDWDHYTIPLKAKMYNFQTYKHNFLLQNSFVISSSSFSTGSIQVF